MSGKLDYSDLIGKPFKLGARGPKFYDCWGLCLELGRRVGLKLPEHFTPDANEDQDKTIRMYRDKDFVKIEEPEPYCIAVYSLAVVPPAVDHCGFILEDCKKMLHTIKQHSVCVIRLDNTIIKRKLCGYYKLCPVK